MDGKNGSSIEIRGAKTHNLKNIDLDIPHGKLTVLTGVSGSGKSSLAFDTLFAEGQRQYLQSLSSFTRQFVDQLEPPCIDSIRGLQPSLCIDQNQGVSSPRSTVGTITEIYDFLRLLMARVATPACHCCGNPIDRQPPTSIIDAIANLPEGSKITIMAPMVLSRKGGHLDVFEKITKSGLLRAHVDGEFVDLESPPILSPRKEHTIAAVVDRLVQKPENSDRIDAAVHTALRLSNGLLSLHCTLPTLPINSSHVRATSSHVREPKDQLTEIDQFFSTRFACVACGISLPEIEPRTFSFNSPYGACSTCEGFGEIGDETKQSCPTCHGDRLRPESLAIRLSDKSIADISKLPISDLRTWLANLQFERTKQPIAEPILKEIQPRLEYLSRVGLGYLTLDRKGDSLSGGELQRVRLATSVGTGLIGVCYVLDEPSIGLHPRDTQRLIEILRSLQKRGNTIVVVEHDEAIMKAADLLVDIGPGAGVHGGEIIAFGPPKKVSRVAESLTGQYLLGTKETHATHERPVEDTTPKLTLTGVTKNNLRNVSVEFPLGRLVGITGVSGSGKSTLIHDSLVTAVQASLTGATLKDQHWKHFTGVEHIDRITEIDQSPIGRSPRSVPATYCGLWDDIRKIYASTRDAKQRGFNAVRFSFNSGNGRCDACAGQGRQKLEMSFLEDVDIPCPECVGKRFNRQTLAVHFKGRSIADVLEMTVDEAVEFFENMDSLKRSLQRLQEVGLGYITLGQRSTTLSGGEAQRLKLANELTRTATGKTLYVLDEPTTGLHLSDVAQLIQVLQGLVERGNSVLVIEHHMDLIRSCDWVIDLGPEGGNEGGKILAVGPPAMLAKLETPTGMALREVMT